MCTKYFQRIFTMFYALSAMKNCPVFRIKSFRYSEDFFYYEIIRVKIRTLRNVRFQRIPVFRSLRYSEFTVLSYNGNTLGYSKL